MDKITTLSAMAGVALALLLAWGAPTQAWAQEETGTTVEKRTIAKGSYTPHTSENWWYYKTSNPGDRHPSGSLGETGWTGVANGGRLSHFMPLEFIYTPETGYTDETLTTLGYIIEFDFKFTYNLGNGDQLMVYTGSAEPPINAAYTGTDYLFSLSYDGSAWHANDLDNSASSVAITLDRAWYHLKLVVTASGAAYTITDTSGAMVASGEKPLPDTAEGIPEVTYIWDYFTLDSEQGHHIYFSTSTFAAYDYIDQNLATDAPTITLKEVDVDGHAVYTIAYEDGGKVYYKLPQDDASADYTMHEGGSSCDVTTTADGTLTAYAVGPGEKRTQSATTSVEVKQPVVVDLPTSGLFSYSYYKGGEALEVEKGAAIYVVQAKSDVDVTNTAVTLTRVTDSRNVSQYVRVIPAGQGVFVYKKYVEGLTGDEDKRTNRVVFTRVSSTVGDAVSLSYIKNVLKATSYKGHETGGVTAPSVSSNNFYFCVKKNTQELWMVQPGLTIPANKAYLPLTYAQMTGSGTAKLNLVFDDGDATGIDGVKAFGDGQSADEGSGKNQGALYNLAGQRVGDTYRGIVVRNGKKYLKK